MRLLLFCLFFLTATVSFGQTVFNKSRKLSFGASVSPDYSFRVPFEYGDMIQDMVNKSFYEIEIPQPGVTAGLNAAVAVTNVCELQTGLLYSYRRIKYKECDNLFILNSARFLNGVPERAQLTHRMHYVSVPLKAGFTFGKKRLQPTVSIGGFADVHIATSTKASLIYPGGSTTTEIHPNGIYYKRLSFSPLISVGGKYWLNEKAYLKIEPTLHAEPPLKGYLWRAGLNLGYYVRL